MNRASIWTSTSFDLPPVATEVGPFPHSEFLETWWDQHGAGELLPADTGDSLVVLTVSEELVEFAGEADLTDYHSPLGSVDVPALSKIVSELPGGSRLQLDSLPAAASDAVCAGLRSIGLVPTIEEHAVSAVLRLPSSFDEYLMSIGKKERHELRRKRRRFENERGAAATLERRRGREAVRLFADLHRRSSGDKGSFMTDSMEEFFFALHERAGGVMDMLVDASGTVAAAVFLFETEFETYLYNSAFNPDLGHLSPGNVMLSHLIEQAIAQERRVFDFLKGRETYKFRLGAEPRSLYRVAATMGPNR
jgi:CelD/BcsL family acetyltransferase involved in cellulose biosynthesis